MEKTVRGENRMAESTGIDIQRYAFFRFMLPELEVGRSDIEITVDYGVDTEHNRVVANVWARIENTMIKGFIYTEFVPPVKKGEEQCRLIAAAINRNPLFHRHLQAFLAWVQNNQLRGENPE